MSKKLLTDEMKNFYIEKANEGWTYEQIAIQLNIKPVQLMGIGRRLGVTCQHKNDLARKYSPGSKVGHLTIIDYFIDTKTNKPKCKCRCECGKEFIRSVRSLQKTDDPSCGCMKKYGDLTGKRFGHWIVLERDKNKNRDSRWLCRCDCGTERIVRQKGLIDGTSQSCGCIPRQKRQENHMNYRKKNVYEFHDKYVVGYTSNKNQKFYIDAEDYDLIKDYTWRSDKNNYVITTIGVPHKTDIGLHRLIMNADDDMVVDHINHNTFDNRKSNLRLCTIQENVWNSKTNSNNKTGQSGVYFLNNKWTALITVNGKTIRLGRFDLYDDAVKTRKKAEDYYYGEYSYNNSLNKTLKGDN